MPSRNLHSVPTRRSSDLKRKAEEQLANLMQKESVVEGRHVTDLKAKATRLFEDCDVLILPRITLIDMMTGWRIPNRVHKLDRKSTRLNSSHLGISYAVFC